MQPDDSVIDELVHIAFQLSKGHTRHRWQDRFELCDAGNVSASIKGSKEIPPRMSLRRVKGRPSRHHNFSPLLKKGQAAIRRLGLWSSDWFIGTKKSHLSLETQRRRVISFVQALHADRVHSLMGQPDPVGTNETLAGPDVWRDPGTAEATEHLYAIHDISEEEFIRRAKDPMNRAPLQSLMRYEEEAQGLDVPGPEGDTEYDSLETPHKLGNAEIKNSTSYIPPHIYGKDVRTGPPGSNRTLHSDLTALCEEFIDVFNTRLDPLPADIQPLELEVDHAKWHIRANAAPVRPQTVTKQDEVLTQVDKMRDLGVIKECQAPYYSHVHLTPKPHQKAGEPTK